MRNQIRSFHTAHAGSAALEFAIVAPFLLALLVGIIAYGSIISVQNGVQQIVAEAARSSIGGLSDTERDMLARAYVTAAVTSYPLVEPGKLTISTDAPSTTTFRVIARYDMSGSFVYRLLNGLPLPSPLMLRNAVVQRGGF